MKKFKIDKKVMAWSTCTLMQGQYDPDPLFCKVTLSEDAIILLNNELSKEDELLFFIPINHIKKFDFIKEKEEKGVFKSFRQVLLKTFFYVSGWIGLFPEYRKKADILGLSYINERGQNVDFILDMMKYGECGLVREYKKLIQL